MAGRTPGKDDAAARQRSNARPHARQPQKAAPRTSGRAPSSPKAAGRAPKPPATSRKPSSSSSARKRRDASSYNAPSLWTKDAPKAPSSGGPVLRALSFVGRALLAVLALVGKGIGWAFRSLGSLVSRSRAALAVVVVAVVLAAGGLVDLGLNWGRAYAGVSIGEIDVSGKTADEMRDLVEQTYAGRLQAGAVTVYASDEAAARVADAMAQAEDAALAEQRSVEEERERRQLWTTDANALSASLPVDDLVDEALAVGREEGGLGARAAALFGGWNVKARADYDAAALEALAADVDATIGSPRVDFGIAVQDGQASVTEGHDGDMVDRGEFASELDRAFLESAGGGGSFVARAEHAPLRIDRDGAQAACDAVNAAIAAGARFSYAGTSWEASATDLGDWVTAAPEERDGAWTLVPAIDEVRAKPAILAHVQETRTGDPVHVTFERDGDDVLVRTDGSGEVPLAGATASALNAALFGEEALEHADVEVDAGGASAHRPASGEPVEVTVGSGSAPAASTFDEALELGLVAKVSEYTTEYTSGAGTENRNHNIHLVSDLLNNSIAEAGGGTWSFNGTAGECNAERGFLGAGAIIDGEYDDAVGGGICQVATTVFNAVYEAGYPVPTRHNHSLYIASYPAGRDAAVSWPDLDLVWKNDTASDVLMRTSYTDGSVTVTLYGVDPGYRVSTDVGEWTEGEKHKTKTERDDTLSPGTSYVKTAGTDGKKITVIRTVASSDGSILHEDPFYSTYDPVTEVVVAGPEAPEKTADASAGGDAAKKQNEEG
ncbi:VanW family protein [Gordonibacter massiliensis (ex Traore et al. 2017)]|uniref:VanW family protein n=1 Tax=Gordonibacter massiliensis (ex Traore et al. 2017) TaxID=1841863 RepID=UPI001C8B2953|nr:VanW family protein [Gordonibacter massiliensis (ex Traore et al. 2017)]MBX9033098.1 vanomycin resistance protein VanB [Gordonibacter massiliensis (ex Traore et al. 2017)]